MTKHEQIRQDGARQGDVLVVPVDRTPDGATALPRETGRVVLAHGERTGHAHAILAPVAQLYAHEENGSGGAPRRYLGLAGPAALQHEEHGQIVLPAGDYEVVIQKEYAPEDIRNVAD